MMDGDPDSGAHLEPGAPACESVKPRFHSAETIDAPLVSPEPDNATREDTGCPSEVWAVVTEQLSDAIIVIDGVGHIVYSNPASAAVLGWDPVDLLGRSLLEVIP
ncbi:MAG: fold, partial [Acidimicrobiaceae bacterium]|nr:fold [Acidimicrobiaceae bacterium]